MGLTDGSAVDETGGIVKAVLAAQSVMPTTGTQKQRMAETVEGPLTDGAPANIPVYLPPDHDPRTIAGH